MFTFWYSKNTEKENTNKNAYRRKFKRLYRDFKKRKIEEEKNVAEMQHSTKNWFLTVDTCSGMEIAYRSRLYC